MRQKSVPVAKGNRRRAAPDQYALINRVNRQLLIEAKVLLLACWSSVLRIRIASICVLLAIVHTAKQ
jgi:hypothetical protein